MSDFYAELDRKERQGRIDRLAAMMRSRPLPFNYQGCAKEASLQAQSAVCVCGHPISNHRTHEPEARRCVGFGCECREFRPAPQERVW